MTCYSVQRRDRISVKGYGFSSFAKILVKILVKKVKTWGINRAKNLLIMLDNLQKMHLKPLQND